LHPFSYSRAARTKSFETPSPFANRAPRFVQPKPLPPMTPSVVQPNQSPWVAGLTHPVAVAADLHLRRRDVLSDDDRFGH
jgi:hypothetical protein